MKHNSEFRKGFNIVRLFLLSMCILLIGCATPSFATETNSFVTFEAKFEPQVIFNGSSTELKVKLEKRTCTDLNNDDVDDVDNMSTIDKVYLELSVMPSNGSVKLAHFNQLFNYDGQGINAYDCLWHDTNTTSSFIGTDVDLATFFSTNRNVQASTIPVVPALRKSGYYVVEGITNKENVSKFRAYDLQLSKVYIPEPNSSNVSNASPQDLSGNPPVLVVIGDSAKISLKSLNSNFYAPTSNVHMVNIVAPSLLNQNFSIPTDSEKFDNELSQITKQFYNVFPNDYDFLVVCTDEQMDLEAWLQGNTGFVDFAGLHVKVKMEETGVVSQGSQYAALPDKSGLFLPANKLTGRLHSICFLNQILADSSSFRGLTYSLLHEMAHHWGAFCDYYPPNNQPVRFVGGHWDNADFYTDIDGVLSNSNFINPGSNNLINVKYSWLELYLMGLMPYADICNKSFQVFFTDSNRQVTNNLTVLAKDLFDPQYGQIGQRCPDSNHSHHDFKMAFVVLSKEKIGREKASFYNYFAEYYGKDIDDEDDLDEYLQATFSFATDNRATMDSSIVLPVAKTSTSVTPPYFPWIGSSGLQPFNTGLPIGNSGFFPNYGSSWMSITPTNYQVPSYPISPFMPSLGFNPSSFAMPYLPNNSGFLSGFSVTTPYFSNMPIGSFGGLSGTPSYLQNNPFVNFGSFSPMGSGLGSGFFPSISPTPFAPMRPTFYSPIAPTYFGGFFPSFLRPY